MEEAIQREHQEIVSMCDTIDRLEEMTLQHFENEMAIHDKMKTDNSPHIHELLSCHQEAHRKILEAIDNIAMIFRDHIQTEEYHLSKGITSNS